MKNLKLIFLFSLLVIALLMALGLPRVKATGVNSVNPPNVIGSNPIQTGTWASTNGYTNVVTFPYAYTVPPIVTLSGSSLAFTNVVTTTNFTVSSGIQTNVWAWSAYYPYPRIQSGTVITLATVPTNVVFAIPYSSPPLVNAIGSATNGNAVVAVQNVTTTGFTLLCNTLNTNIWEALGPSANPGAAVPTQ